MEPHAWGLFLSAGMGISSILVIANVWLSRKRGISSLILASGCAFLGLLFYALLNQASELLIKVLATLIFLCILGDIFLRFGRSEPTKTVSSQGKKQKDKKE